MKTRTRKMIETLRRAAFDAGYLGDYDSDERDTAYRAMETAERMLIKRTESIELAVRAHLVHLETMRLLVEDLEKSSQ